MHSVSGHSVKRCALDRVENRCAGCSLVRGRWREDELNYCNRSGYRLNKFPLLWCFSCTKEHLVSLSFLFRTEWAKSHDAAECDRQNKLFLGARLCFLWDRLLHNLDSCRDWLPPLFSPLCAWRGDTQLHVNSSEIIYIVKYERNVLQSQAFQAPFCEL